MEFAVFGIILTLLAIVINSVYALKKGLYSYASKHVLAYTLFALPICISVFLLIQSGHNNWEDASANIIINIVSNYLILIAFGVAYFIERAIKNRCEDNEKLTNDYRALTELYNKEPLISEGETTYPVSLVGEGDICVFTKESGITIRDQITIKDCNNEYQLPGLIENCFFDILKIHDTSVLYNNLNIRALELSFSNDHLEMTTERTYYYFSMVTNRAPDYEWKEDGVTVRSIYEPGPKLRSLDQSYLSNHLGFNGFIITSDNYVVFVKRNSDVSIGKRTYGGSIGASLKTKYALNSDGEFTADNLIEAILHEIDDELKIKRENITNIHVISAYRDAVECGKPQLLFYAKTDMTALAVEQQFMSASKEKLTNKISVAGRKQRKRLKDEMHMLEDGTKLVWINMDLISELQFEEDGIIYNGDTENRKGFFEIKNSKNIVILRKQFLPMVPSASASLVMLKNNYKRGLHCRFSTPCKFCANKNCKNG